MHFLSMRQLAWSLVLFAAYLYLGHARFILVEVEEPKKEKLATALMKGVRYNTFCIACTNVTIKQSKMFFQFSIQFTIFSSI